MEVNLSELEDVELLEDSTVTLKRMPHNAPGSTYLVIAREPGAFPAGAAMSVMKFTDRKSVV